MKGTAWVIAAAVYLMAAAGSWAQSMLSPSLQASLRRNVFEVVVAKPKEDPLSYAKPLPLNLLPYTERTDTQYSIGTAFSIGRGRFISAAHVFALDSPTLLGAIALRDSSGKIYPVGDILSYSTRRDYAVFTVPGLEAKGLSLSETYRLNEPVYSVGNALGQGVVIRDGVLTSLTPEDRSGAWKWIRFSAAASPGNSGGPLVEANGTVIGIIEMKSPDENLNYALPISQVSMRPAAILDIQGQYTLPNLTASAPLGGKESFRLPLPVDRLRSEMSKAEEAMNRKAGESLADGRVAPLFPKSPGSAPALGDTGITTFPMLIGESPDQTWHIDEAGKSTTSQIGTDGSLTYGDLWSYSLFSFDKPSGTTLIRLFKDPRRLMDLILQGYPMTRTIASQAIRITSLGKPAFTRHLTDSYGRRWLAVRWDIPLGDLSEVLMALPTPTGAVGYMVQCNYSQWRDYLFDMRFLANFLYVSYRGTFKQWETFLADPGLRPRIFDSLHFRYSPLGSFLLDASRFSFTYTPSLLPVSDNSEMTIVPAYYRDGGRVVWAVARVIVKPSPLGRGYFAIDKTFRPGQNASDARKQTWAALSQQAYPYDRSPSWGNGTTQVDGTLEMSSKGKPIGSPHFLYGLHLSLPGSLSSSAAGRKFELFKEGLHLKPAEIASAAGESVPAPAAKLATEDGETIFQAISTNDTAAFREFLAGKVDLGVVDGDGSTPLMVALTVGRTTMAKELVRAGVAVNVENAGGETPLLLALKHTGYATARLLLDKGADTNVRDAENVTPLMLAMPRKFRNLAEDFIGSGVDINVVSKNHHSALFEALLDGRDAIANELIQAGARLDLTDKQGWTLLMAAVRYCSSSTAQELIDQGAPLGGEDSAGWTPVDLALRYGHNHIALELIRAKPGSTHAVTHADHLTALMFAAAYGTPQIVQALLKRGADPYKHDTNGWTPLMDAISDHHPTIARLLVDKMTAARGASPNGLTALDLAFIHRDDAVASALVKLSSTHQINLATSKGVTPLDFAAQHASALLLDALIAKGAKLHVQDSTGWTPLMYALRYGREESAWAIISHLHSAPEADNNGWNALHFAARYMPAYLPDLVRLGLPVNGKTGAGWTPLGLAASAGHLEAVKWLVAHGASTSLTNNSGARAIDIARSYHQPRVVAYLASLGS